MGCMTVAEFNKKQAEIRMLVIPDLEKEMLREDLAIEWRFQQIERKLELIMKVM